MESGDFDSTSEFWKATVVRFAAAERELGIVQRLQPPVEFFSSVNRSGFRTAPQSIPSTPEIRRMCSRAARPGRKSLTLVDCTFSITIGNGRFSLS